MRIMTNLKPQTTLSSFLTIFLFAASTSLSMAAQYDVAEYESLLEEADSKGFVRVLITLDDKVTLDDMANEQFLTTIRETLKYQAQNVLAELGQNALKSGYWNNGIGQMGAYVNDIGLRILADSNNAISFTRDVTHAYRIKAVDDDGSLDAIEAAINIDGSAEVEILLNTDSVDYDLDSRGKAVFRPSPRMSEQVQRIFANLNATHFAQGINVKEIDKTSPVIKANIDRNAFYALIESDDVRAVRPVGYTDPRKAQWPEEVLEAAREHGEAEITITLRGGGFSSAKTGYLSPNAINAQAKAYQRVFNDILATIGAPEIDTDVLSGSEIGVLQIKLPLQALAKLYQDADPRVLSVDLNKPVAWATLTNSTNLLNMSSAWNAGFRAAGQNIVIIDSGIRKNHAFFTTGGVSRVGFEACFGTNASVEGVLYKSICPNSNTLGDSPLNFPGAGEPYANLAVCNTLATLPPPFTHECSHGTHVAGIAAGRQSASITPSNLQGVAPDATLISAQVFSYNDSAPRAGAFNNDIQKALQTVYDNTVTGIKNPFVVNMSLGGADYPQTSGDCDNFIPAIKTLILNLTSRGVPVVAAAGNNSSRNGISWPACVSQAIKVSSVRNNTSGTTLSGFSNIGNPSSFIGPILLAPGGGDGTSIRSADRASTTATKLQSGTSQAAPHVAGIYAAVKAAFPSGISVADITAWVVSSASIPVTYNLPSPVGTQTYRRVRIPNL